MSAAVVGFPVNPKIKSIVGSYPMKLWNIPVALAQIKVTRSLLNHFEVYLIGLDGHEYIQTETLRKSFLLSVVKESHPDLWQELTGA
jgi:hypothetical protein